MWLFHESVQTWYVHSKNLFHGLEKETKNQKDLVQMGFIYIYIPLKLFTFNFMGFLVGLFV